MRLHRYRTDSVGFLHLAAEDGGEAFRQLGSSVSAESRGGLFLYDADNVFQYLYHVAHQLHDHYLAGRFHTYLPCLYMGTSGLCIGCGFRWQRWRFRFLVAGAMGCFAVFFGILYFTISPESTYEMLFFPIFIRGVGMLVLIIAFGLFAVEDLNPKFLLSNAFFLILCRSVLAPLMATSFYSNTLYHLQQKYIHSLSETITMVDPLAASKFSQSLSSGIGQGHGYAEATQMATTSLYSTLQQQSLLLALKDILGWLFIVTLVIAVVSRFIPFHKTIRVTFAKADDDMV